MNKHKRNMILSIIIVIISFGLIVNALVENSRFVMANITGQIGLLIVGAIFFAINYKNYKKS